MRLAGVVLVQAALSGAAWAQPATLPLHDVSVVYRPGGAAREALPGGIPGDVRVAWSAGRQRLRVEAEGRTQALLVDLEGRRADIFDSGLHSAMSIPVRAKDLEPLRLQNARLTRRGQAVVAGLACTDYAVESRRGHGTVCLTDDGVALRAVGEVDGRAGSFTAVSVSGAAVAASLFEVPPGFMRLALPGNLMGLPR